MDLAKLLTLLQGAHEGSEYLDHAIQRVLFRMSKPVPLYTRSLDAAMTVLPEGWTINRLGALSDCHGGTSGWVADLFRPEDAVIAFPSEGTAATAPLALCAAAVRTQIGLGAPIEEPQRRRARA
jgi:hypothetical protein